MKGIIYIRVSSEEQVDGTSLKFQEDECKKYAAQHSIQVVEIFREEGESAKSLAMNNRREFLRAVEYCRKQKGEIGAFIVLRVNRFARNTEDHFAVRKILLGYGTSLHSVTEPIGNKPSEKFTETLLAAAADYENAIRRQQCTDGMSEKVNAGIWPWKPPIGYKSAHFKKRDEKKTAADPIDEQVFPIIQRGLKEYATGLYSQAEIGRKLDLWGLAEIRGKKADRQFIDRMVGRNLKFYTGILLNPWTNKEVQGLHKYMINKDEMYQILAVRSGKSFTVKRNHFNPLFPLRGGTVLCGVCKRPYTGSTTRGNGGQYSYYHCANSSCSFYGKGINKATLEDEFVKHLNKITPSRRFMSVFKETVIDLWREQGQVFELEVQRRDRELADLEAKKKRVYEMREDGSYSKEEFLERKQQIENEVAAVTISRNEARIEQFDIEAAVTYADNFITNLGRQWFDLKSEIKPKFQKLVFPDGIPYVRGEGFGTAKLGFIYETNQRFVAGSYHMVVFV